MAKKDYDFLAETTQEYYDTNGDITGIGTRHFAYGAVWDVIGVKGEDRNRANNLVTRFMGETSGEQNETETFLTRGDIETILGKDLTREFIQKRILAISDEWDKKIGRLESVKGENSMEFKRVHLRDPRALYQLNSSEVDQLQKFGKGRLFYRFGREDAFSI